MATINKEVVARSNALLGYSKNLCYYEGFIQMSFFSTLNFFIFLVLAVSFISMAPTRWFLRKYVLPK